MVEIENKSIFSNLSFLQIIIVIMKFVIYLDYHDIKELNFGQSGGGDEEKEKPPPSKETTKNTSTKSTESPKTPAANKPSNAVKVPEAAKEAATEAGAGALNAGLASTGVGAPAAAALKMSGVNKVVAGAAVDMASSTVENASSANQSALNKGLEDDLSKDEDMKGIKTGFINNNWIFYIVKQAMDIVSRVAGTAGEIVSRLFMIFIFAATFPALPFFAVMGLVYAFAKYGAFKFRGL